MANQGQWLPGKSANPGAKRSLKILSDALNISLCEDPRRARRIADRLLDIAENDPDPRIAIAAMSLAWARLEGAPVQVLDATIQATAADRPERLARLIELQVKAAATNVVDISVARDKD